MRISFYGNPNNFYDNAFFDYESDDFNVDLISSSSTRLVVENPSTEARTVFNGSGIVASDNDGDIRGTLSSIDFYNSSGNLVATFSQLDWGLREFISAVDDELIGGDQDPLTELLAQGGGITLDVSGLTIDLDDFDDAGMIESLGVPVTYIGLDDSGDDNGGDDTPDMPEQSAIFPDGFDASTTPDEAASIYRLYQATLDRAPDVGGLSGWTEHLVTGENTLLQVANAFVASQEFQNTYGTLGNSGFVSLLYQNVLGRDADAGGLAGWTAQLEGGMSRAQVVTGFSNSAEFVEATASDARAFVNATSQAGWTDDVYRIYQATLDRAPDYAGLEGWTEQLAGGRELGSVISAFVGSQEFQNTYGDLDDAGFVNQLYLNVLDRGADAGGLSGWVAQLDGGMSRAEVVEGFSQSNEFRTATNDALQSWMQQQSFDDTITAPEGESLLAGGFGSDVFVFDADTAGSHRVLDFEAWDYAFFQDFGYDSVTDVLSHMEQSDNDVLFSDQDVNIIFEDTQINTMVDNLLYI